MFLKKSTTEITSLDLVADNPVHQRQLFAYIEAKNYVKGDLLELGCGRGRGIETLKNNIENYTTIDKNDFHLDNLSKEYPNYTFINDSFPPFKGIKDNSYDSVIAFQVIEHIKDDHLFVKEMIRVLKPGGIALITTPNIVESLSRNPWHVREYTSDELLNLCKKYHNNVEIKSIKGNEKMMKYHEENRASVNKIMRFDIFNLQHNLPAPILRIPYEFFNRMNRNKLEDSNNELTKSISHTDFEMSDNGSEGLDLFVIIRK